MELLSKAFGVYETNCYILKTTIGDFIIDAGVDSAQWVVENATNPLAILNTHGHFDHIWCNAELRERLQVPIFCPKGDAFMLKSDCFDLGLKPCAPDIEVGPNEIFRFGRDFIKKWREMGESAVIRHCEQSEESKDCIFVEFMHFAGHTPGCSMIKISGANSPCSDFLGSASSRSLQRTASPSHSLNSHNPKNSSTMLEFASSVESADSHESNGDSGESNIYIFSGDFIFYRTIGRSDFPYSSPKDMGESLKRFGEIPYNAALYPGHGQPTTIKNEQKHLPLYLRGLVC